MSIRSFVDGASAIAFARTSKSYLIGFAFCYGIAGGFHIQTAQAQPAPTSASSRIACPERIKTTAGQVTDRSAIADFTEVLGGETSAQSWLQDVALYAAADDSKAISGKADGRRRITWALDGATDVLVGCIYEGGITMTREAGKPKSCTASILRSKDPNAGGWGMERAEFTCR